MTLPGPTVCIAHASLPMQKDCLQRVQYHGRPIWRPHSRSACCSPMLSMCWCAASRALPGLALTVPVCRPGACIAVQTCPYAAQPCPSQPCICLHIPTRYLPGRRVSCIFQNHSLVVLWTGCSGCLVVPRSGGCAVSACWVRRSGLGMTGRWALSLLCYGV